MNSDKTTHHIKLDECNLVDKPHLDHLAGLGWEVIENKKETAAV